MTRRPGPNFTELACATLSVFCLGYGLLATGIVRAVLVGAAVVSAIVGVCIGIARWRRSRDG